MTPNPEGHMASYIERRKFLATLLGGAAAWPLATRAQQGERMRRIGVLLSTGEGNPATAGSARRLGAAADGIRLGRRPQRAPRRPLDRRQCRRCSKIRGGT